MFGGYKMKILAISDIHNQETAAEVACSTEKPDLVLDCGDRDRLKNISGLVPHYYVRGNHEPSQVYFKDDEYPLPHKIDPRQIYTFFCKGQEIRFSGLGGNYSVKEPLYAISERDVGFLKKMGPNSLDILLLHESPFNYSPVIGKSKEVAKSILEEIDRICPKLVISGHIGKYMEKNTLGGVPIYSLDDIGVGYGLLNVCEGGDIEFQRKISRFMGDKFNKPKQ
jgi:predicted phosphodiesterase